jgi:hypothetical protein
VCCICNVWSANFERLSQLLVVTAVKCPINPINNPNPVYSHTRSRDNIIINVRAVGCDSGRWRELASLRVQSRALLLTAFNLRILLLEKRLLITKLLKHLLLCPHFKQNSWIIMNSAILFLFVYLTTG